MRKDLCGICGGDNTQCTEVTGVRTDRNLTRGESGSQCVGGGQYSVYRGDGGQDRNLTRGESGSQCGGGQYSMYRGDGGQDRNLTRGESGSQCGGGQYSMYRGDGGQPGQEPNQG